MRRSIWIVVALALGLAFWLGTQWQRPATAPIALPPGGSAPATLPRGDAPSRERTTPPVEVAGLPPEAGVVLRRIADGSPHPYRQDGSTFQNRERRLPSRERGYYREYTVETPGSRDRGARRIVTGGDPPTEYWYTDDHYRSFRRFEVSR